MFFDSHYDWVQRNDFIEIDSVAVFVKNAQKNYYLVDFLKILYAWHFWCFWAF